MNITTEKTEEFKMKVEQLIPKYAIQGQVKDYDKFLKELLEYAVSQSSTYIPARLELWESHRTKVDNTQLDYDSICLAIILISWAVRMRKVKSDEGQCHVHMKDCADTRKMHSEIYDQWIEVVEEALKALKAGRPGR
ncbi:MAG: hypothetical protein GEU26_12290 [Nitrososphaeraceae archaeon]|nr:hypothetical protein [Nitrososphaeraceae archaeon]